jgi:hypothetical protein
MSQAVDPVVRSSFEQLHRSITDPAARGDVDSITQLLTVALKQLAERIEERVSTEHVKWGSERSQQVNKQEQQGEK